MKKNDIVKDALGNHFRVLSVGASTARLESVATKEVYLASRSELQPTERVAF